MTRRLPGPARQHGLSLIELLVALVLSGTLMAGVVGVFLGMFQADRAQQGVAQLQESGRFALNLLAQDLRMAGYLGCASTLDPASIGSTLAAPPASFQPARHVQGWEAAGSDPGEISNSAANVAVVATSASGWGSSGGNVLDSTSAVPGTDILRVWGADTSVDGSLISVTPGASTVLGTDLAAGITAGDLLLLSDCEQADWVQACAVQQTGTPATLALTLSAGCAPGNVANPQPRTGPGASVMKLAGTLYYIGKRNNASNNPPALFRRRLGANGLPGAPEELVEGVENLQLLYGENTDNDARKSADRFVPADQVGDWSQVVSVRLSLLLQSLEDNLVPDPQPYSFNGVDYDGTAGNGALPPDGRLRRVFTGTINLRNVTLGG